MEVGRKFLVILVVGPVDEEGVFHHKDGKEVEDEIHDDRGANAAPNEFGLGQAANITALRDFGHGAEDDWVSVLNLFGNLEERN